MMMLMLSATAAASLLFIDAVFGARKSLIDVDANDDLAFVLYMYAVWAEWAEWSVACWW